MTRNNVLETFNVLLYILSRVMYYGAMEQPIQNKTQDLLNLLYHHTLTSQEYVSGCINTHVHALRIPLLASPPYTDFCCAVKKHSASFLRRQVGEDNQEVVFNEQ